MRAAVGALAGRAVYGRGEVGADSRVKSIKEEVLLLAEEAVVESGRLRRAGLRRGAGGGLRSLWMRAGRNRCMGGRVCLVVLRKEMSVDGSGQSIQARST